MSIAALCAQIGCAQTAEELAGEAAEEAAEEAAAPATDQALAELETPESRRRINRLLGLPGIQDTGELFGNGFARGTYAFIGHELTGEQLEAVARTYVEAIGAAIDAELSETFGAQARARGAHFAASLSRAIVDTAIRRLAQQLPEQLGPALRRMIRDEVGEGIAEALRQHIAPAAAQMMRDEQLQQALAESARTIGRHSVLGANKAVAELSEPRQTGGGPLEGLSEAVSRGEQTLQTVLWMLGIAVLVLLLIVVALGLGTWRIMARSRELIEENKLREDALAGMARAVQAAEQKDSAQILERVLGEMEHRKGVDEVRALLRRAGFEPPADLSPPPEQ